jgi:hypothetical protein
MDRAERAGDREDGVDVRAGGLDQRGVVQTAEPDAFVQESDGEMALLQRGRRWRDDRTGSAGVADSCATKASQAMSTRCRRILSMRSG